MTTAAPTTMTDALARGRTARSEAAFAGVAVIKAMILGKIAQTVAPQPRHA
jgi:hypothetical protein